MPQVSVIIPVFNAEKYLRRCLDSVCGQTLADIEIICVDDASTDGSAAIIAEYAAEDPRVKAISFSENRGAAMARNAGIDAATGAYVGFVDADDYAEASFYGKLLKATENGRIDIVKGVYRYVPGNRIDYSLNDAVRKDKNSFSFEYCSALFSMILVRGANVRFPALRDMEDPVFTLQAAILANEVRIVDDAVLNVFLHPESQTAATPTVEVLQEKFRGFESLVSMLDDGSVAPETAGYVLAVWYNGLFFRCEDMAWNACDYLARRSLEVLRSIFCGREFFAALKLRAPLLAETIRRRDYADVVMYGRERLRQDLGGRVKELEVSLRCEHDLHQSAVRAYVPAVPRRKACDKVVFVSVVNDYEMYGKCLEGNPFVYSIPSHRLVDYDNRRDNVPIPVRYNDFLDGYDYDENAWFVFCHCDWEPLEPLDAVLADLDRDCLYGPVGSCSETVGGVLYREIAGGCHERRRDGSALRKVGGGESSLRRVDTFDCQALIVHSSLIRKFHLRFDEQFPWDLYVEDLCVSSRLRHAVESYAIRLECCHWSGWHETPRSYWTGLEKFNRKYPAGVFSGTVSALGGAAVGLRNPSSAQCVFREMRKRYLKHRTGTCGDMPRENVG